VPGVLTNLLVIAAASCRWAEPAPAPRWCLRPPALLRLEQCQISRTLRRPKRPWLVRGGADVNLGSRAIGQAASPAAAVLHAAAWQGPMQRARSDEGVGERPAPTDWAASPGQKTTRSPPVCRHSVAAASAGPRSPEAGGRRPRRRPLLLRRSRQGQ
jgi:hypothetical protein